eukprot:TRINITY_DN11763_c0_g1_i4.p1 TRINITY_DN11763_c0_g1~~TRINITY_DN11763_c0_g1_i4.p1  ORF type:complete len:774 (+),score=147.23 TRINITY_DN11763_c0_g1_i4:47-2368(+)
MTMMTVLAVRCQGPECPLQYLIKPEDGDFEDAKWHNADELDVALQEEFDDDLVEQCRDYREWPRPFRVCGSYLDSNDLCSFCLDLILPAERERSLFCRRRSCPNSACPRCVRTRLQFDEKKVVRLRRSRWECIQCKTCFVCNKASEEGMVFCDHCDKGVHCLRPSGRDCDGRGIDPKHPSDDVRFLCTKCEKRHARRADQTTPAQSSLNGSPVVKRSKRISPRNRSRTIKQFSRMSSNDDTDDTSPDDEDDADYSVHADNDDLQSVDYSPKRRSRRNADSKAIGMANDRPGTSVAKVDVDDRADSDDSDGSDDSDDNDRAVPKSEPGWPLDQAEPASGYSTRDPSPVKRHGVGNRQHQRRTSSRDGVSSNGGSDQRRARRVKRRGPKLKVAPSSSQTSIASPHKRASSHPPVNDVEDRMLSSDDEDSNLSTKAAVNHNGLSAKAGHDILTSRQHANVNSSSDGAADSADRNDNHHDAAYNSNQLPKLFSPSRVGLPTAGQVSSAHGQATITTNGSVGPQLAGEEDMGMTIDRESDDEVCFNDGDDGDLDTTATVFLQGDSNPDSDGNDDDINYNHDDRSSISLTPHADSLEKAGFDIPSTTDSAHVASTSMLRESALSSRASNASDIDHDIGDIGDKGDMDNMGDKGDMADVYRQDSEQLDSSPDNAAQIDNSASRGVYSSDADNDDHDKHDSMTSQAVSDAPIATQSISSPAIPHASVDDVESLRQLKSLLSTKPGCEELLERLTNLQNDGSCHTADQRLTYLLHGIKPSAS